MVRNAGKDPDAPRRLYCVAMTRARQTLTLARFDGSRGFPHEWLGHAATIRREAAELPPCSAAVEYRHVRAALQDVDLGFAGRRRPTDPIHQAIAALSSGDSLDIRIGHDGRWELRDAEGVPVGRLAKSFKPPPGMRYRSAEVFAVVSWSREASDPEYRDAVQCDAWETVVPELVFEPGR